MDKKKRQIKKLLKVYQKEFYSGHLEHINDYIAINVILSLSGSQKVMLSPEINKVNLNDLICSDTSAYIQEIKEYEVPSLNFLDRHILQYENIVRNTRNDEFPYRVVVPTKQQKQYNAAKWLKLMITLGLIKESDIIDLTEYRLVNFINDPRLIEILDLWKEENLDLIVHNKVKTIRPNFKSSAIK